MKIRQRNTQNIKIETIRKFSKNRGGIEFMGTNDIPFIRTIHSEMYPSYIIVL